MKRIPNILTFLRIILAIILLLFFHKITPLFIGIFLVAMLTDLVDGTLARKFDACSPSGALLDTIADFLLDANLVKIVFTMRIMTRRLTFWLIIALCVGALSPIINFIKHKKIFFIHSILCKLCMWALVGIPFAIQLGFAHLYITITLSLISIAMIELVIISILLKVPDPDSQSVYSIIKNINSF